MVAEVSDRTLTMYVAGEPGLRPNLDAAVPGFTGRLATLFVPFSGQVYARGVGAAAILREPPDDLPPTVRQCVRLVLDLAQKTGWSVKVVDVTRQTLAEAEILRTLGSNGLLPILERPDGERLVGEEKFTPGQLRRFLKTSA